MSVQAPMSSNGAADICKLFRKFNTDAPQNESLADHEQSLHQLVQALLYQKLPLKDVMERALAHLREHRIAALSDWRIRWETSCSACRQLRTQMNWLGVVQPSVTSNPDAIREAIQRWLLNLIQ